MIEGMLICITAIFLWTMAQPIKMVKILRRQCLTFGCKNKATHFGICGHKSYGFCDNCYDDYNRSTDELLENLKCFSDELEKAESEEKE